MVSFHEVSYFLGANAPSGFYSLYSHLLPPEQARGIYILKGGPGCGKSTLMRKVAQLVSQQGEAVEYILCSGDPGSLDAVIFPAWLPPLWTALPPTWWSLSIPAWWRTMWTWARATAGNPFSPAGGDHAVHGGLQGLLPAGLPLPGARRERLMADARSPFSPSPFWRTAWPAVPRHPDPGAERPAHRTRPGQAAFSGGHDPSGPHHPVRHRTGPVPQGL